MHKVYLPGVDWLLSFTVCALLFTGFAMGGVANAINIIDGFNGLASGSLLIMLAAFAFVADRVGDELVFSLAILYGALVLGFFVVNFPLGKIFLGDGGAYFAASCSPPSGCCCRCAIPMRLGVDGDPDLRLPGDRDAGVDAAQGQARRAQRRAAGPGAFPHARPSPLRAADRRARRGRCTCAIRRRASSPGCMPLMTAIFAAIAYDSVVGCAFFFFVTVFIYGQLYRIMSLNAPNLPLGLARLL